MGSLFSPSLFFDLKISLVMWIQFNNAFLSIVENRDNKLEKHQKHNDFYCVGVRDSYVWTSSYEQGKIVDRKLKQTQTTIAQGFGPHLGGKATVE